ncbi:MAG: pyridoxal phosphate-dependent aminotransferase [Burkholderiaceae bacterium]|jgi:aspartate/methionine/tyrosine aminotransferase|nr:pyridoxal phosphate-dependent aminotransferase [Burkholderiaceae bacterium]
MIRNLIEALPASRIREVANAGIGRTDVLKFWFGEGDQVTPAFIRDAAKASLDAGQTFYNHNLGIAELRDELAAYANRLHVPARPVTADRIAVTSAGVHALALIDQALIAPGDRVAIVTPVWPNLTAMPRIMSAEVVRVPLDCRGGAWSLDLQRLLDAATPGTRMVLVNAPNNPTGWTMPRPDWVELLAHCRRHGIWLVSDDAYERIVFEPGLTINGHAPSVLDLVEDDDRYISANTFSKSWTMTGWRLGWMVAPPEFIAQVGKVIEFNTSCAPPFVQHAGLAAVRDGEPLVAATVARLRRSRDLLVDALATLPGVEVAPPPGAMYLFFRVAGFSDDSLAFAKRLVAEAGLGIAPGVAFGPEGEGFLRWCFAASDTLLLQGAERMRAFLKRALAA